MGMDDAGERFDGNVLSLVTEQNFERMFQYDLPSGWQLPFAAAGKGVECRESECVKRRSGAAQGRPKK